MRKWTQIPCILLVLKKELVVCFPPEMKTEWEKLGSRDCVDSFTADTSGNFPLELVARNTRNMTRENLVSLKKIQVLRIAVSW